MIEPRPSARKIFAGHAVRRLRLRVGLSQVGFAERVGVSPSYLNLIERNQRPLTAPVLLRLAETFDFDPRELTAAEPAGGVEALRRRLADPRFADLGVDRDETMEWLAAAPRGAEAFARAFDLLAIGSGAPEERDVVDEVRNAIERWRNHFADLDEAAEQLADELRLAPGDLYGSISERLRVRHNLTVRVLPVEVMPDRLRRLDLHARQLQLCELLSPPSRTFAVAYHLGQIEARGEIEALIKGMPLSRPAERLFRRHLLSYYAAALMMPYARFLRACEGTGYDVELLQSRFGAGFEQVAHRLTTLGRVGSRGLPFFMLRFDRAGQVSKRYAGSSGSPLVEARGRCPLWDVHGAFEQPGRIVRSLAELEDGSRVLALARLVTPALNRTNGVRAEFAVVLGLAAEAAGTMVAAAELDLLKGAATPIGLGCRDCLRPACPQRSAPPTGRALQFNERERGLSAWEFVGD